MVRTKFKSNEKFVSCIEKSVCLRNRRANKLIIRFINKKKRPKVRLKTFEI